ncbi:hypothetical protein K458DRAFT_43963 [Lentithecium fluviatile CBS 122367]|uniref:Uncharacterized protein n=1 Tax=Lentithecium fluviatile CBS 122367 TaxID=1168545 RepID=A0A6G1IZ74_9PLEO|nr:hypothetical protein K458DRAFT_43963 [Lentithecium fluviatile CBS 122367]
MPSQPTNVVSTTPSRYPQDPSEKPLQQSQKKTEPTNNVVLRAFGPHRKNNGGNFADEAEALFTVSQTTKQRSEYLPRLDTARNLQRPFEAPEVVPADFEGMHSKSPHAGPSSEKYPAFLTESDYADRLLSLPAGIDNAWMPLKRPAMHNRYHGFCKGAWEIRKAIPKGLKVQMTPTSKEPIIHWACKECKFKSRAPSADALPNHILFNQKYGVRYRWLFLAKSHRGTASSYDVPENYWYGCIICAA